jgi:hypothetical protein
MVTFDFALPQFGRNSIANETISSPDRVQSVGEDPRCSRSYTSFGIETDGFFGRSAAGTNVNAISTTTTTKTVV